MATVGACAGFGAICGSSLATVATMGRVALPEMRRRGYDDRLASASIAAGGTLGVLIPPSIILVIYALMTRAVDWRPVHGCAAAGAARHGALHAVDPGPGGAGPQPGPRRRAAGRPRTLAGAARGLGGRPPPPSLFVVVIGGIYIRPVLADRGGGGRSLRRLRLRRLPPAAEPAGDAGHHGGDRGEPPGMILPDPDRRRHLQLLHRDQRAAASDRRLHSRGAGLEPISGAGPDHGVLHSCSAASWTA